MELPVNMAIRLEEEANSCAYSSAISGWPIRVSTDTIFDRVVRLVSCKGSASSRNDRDVI